MAVQDVDFGDIIINPFSWNAILLRVGKYYSINHYRPGISATTGEKLLERMEIRYQLAKIQDWDNMKVNPADHGVKFDDLGYVVGYRSA
jgi:hypothetical protein